MSVALVAALTGRRFGKPFDIAIEAWELETIDASVAGGQQDQLAAALGGFQHLTFDRGGTSAQAIDVDPTFASHLEEHLVVCHTGRSRFSGNTITRVMNSYREGDHAVCDALRSLADIADTMKRALDHQDLEAIGALLQNNWEQQQRLAAGMQTPEMARLEVAMRQAGAIGGKAAGSGAGGSMFFVVPGDTTAARDAANRAGSAVIPFTFAHAGVSRG
jgi:D-glycero-alpha-D-manno-heptose-7-phosphate kinase